MGLGEDHDDDDGLDLRSQLQANFELYDKGDLTEANAATLQMAKSSGADEPSADKSPVARAKQGGDQSSPVVDRPAETSDRPRDASGRFAPKSSEIAPDAPAKSTDTQPAASDKPADDKAPAPAQAWDAPAPASFSDAGKAAWQTLHPEIREHLTAQRAQHESQLRQLGEPLLPLREIAQARGMSWQDGLSRLIEAQRALDRDPYGALIWLAQSSGVNLDELADRAAAGGAQQQTHPQQQQPGIPPQLLSRIDAIEQRFQSEQERQRQAAADAALREVNTFASDPANRHWAAVEQDVYQLLPAMKARMPNAASADVLRAAYDAAVWANPQTRALAMQEQRAAEAAKEREQRTGQTRQARALEVLTSHRGTPPAHQPAPNGHASLRDEIGAHWDAWEAARQ